MARGSRARIRFDLRDETFARVATEYRRAIKNAESLWCRVTTPGVRATKEQAERLSSEFARAEERLDAARKALLEHTKAVAKDPMRTRVKRLGLGVPRDREAPTAA